MTTIQPEKILNLPNPLFTSTVTSTPSKGVSTFTNAVPSDTVPRITQITSQDYPVNPANESSKMSSLPVVRSASMAVPDTLVSDILPCDDKPAQQVETGLATNSDTEGESESPEPNTVVVHASSPKYSLSANAAVWCPSNPKLYPVGVNRDGVEWSVSDEAWMTLQYGKADIVVTKNEEAAKLNIDKHSKLKTLEVILPGGQFLMTRFCQNFASHSFLVKNSPRIIF